MIPVMHATVAYARFFILILCETRYSARRMFIAIVRWLALANVVCWRLGHIPHDIGLKSYTLGFASDLFSCCDSNLRKMSAGFARNFVTHRYSSLMKTFAEVVHVGLLLGVSAHTMWREHV